jgi:predicted permease
MWHRRRRTDDEFREEIEAHLTLETDQLIADGVDPGQAAVTARRALGNVALIHERFYESGRVMWLEDLVQDVRFTIRSLRRSPGFAATTVLMLALGIGMNTAVFSVVNGVLLRPLPYTDPDRLVLLEHPSLSGSPPWLTAAWRARARSLDDFAAFGGPEPATVVRGGEPVQARIAEVTSNFFPLLGISPAEGTLFSVSDSADSPAGAVLSHRYWQRQFGGNPALLGQTITVTTAAGSIRLVVVGILRPDFRFPSPSTPGRPVLSPGTQPDVIALANGTRWLRVIGRVSRGTTAEAASAELQGIFKQEAPRYFSSGFVERESFVATRLQDRLIGDTRYGLLLLTGAVACVLLIVCANFANLLLARQSTRQIEYAVRAALGARMGRLARLVLTESLMLTGISAAAALLVAHWAGRVTQSLLVQRVAYVDAVAIDWRVLAFSAILAVVVGLVSALASILVLRSIGFNGAFNYGGGRSITGRMRIRQTLLVAEVAITVVLVVTAALLSQTLWNLYHAKRGFEGERILTLGVMPNMSGTIPEIQQLASTFFTDLTVRVAGVPGVESAAAASTVPLDHPAMSMSDVTVIGQPMGPTGAGPVSVAAVTPGYFGTIGTRLFAGRDFTRADSKGSERVAIVNDAFRRRIASDQTLVGARINFGRYPLTVVGVAEDTPDRSPRQPASPFVFIPLEQSIGSSFAFGRLMVLARTQHGNPATLLPAIRRAVWAVGDDIVIDEEATMNERLTASIRTERDSALLFCLLAVVALLVAVTGVYGVVAYSVVQRTREIGIRLALGAGHGRVVGAVVQASVWPVAVGIAIGLCGAAVATRAVASVLFGTPPVNPTTFAVAALALAAAALIAAWLPARHAARIDPTTALRAE